MSIQLLLFKTTSSAVDITNIVQKIKWKGRKGSAARSITVTILDDDGYEHARSGIDVSKGHQCIFSENGSELFRGIIMTTSQSNKKTMTFTAYDNGIYLANNKDTFCYEKKTADAIFTDILNRFGLPAGSVAKCNYTIPELTKSKTTAFDAIADALSLDYENTNVRHYVSSNKGKLSLLKRTENVVQIVIEPGANLISYSYSNSIENTKTRIKLLSDEGKTLAEEKNSSLEDAIGVFQDVDIPDETLTTAQIKSLAKSLLAEKGEVEQSFTVDALGISSVIAGVAVFVKISHLDISKTFYVDEDTHTWDGKTHTMSLKLNRVSDAGEFAASSSEEKKTTTTTYKVTAKSGLHIRSGPSTSNKSLSVLPNGTKFVHDGQKSGSWLHGTANGHTGWSYGSYLAKV